MIKKKKYDNYTKEELVIELEALKKKKYGLVWDRKNSKEYLDAFVNWENLPENFIPDKFPVLKEIKNKEINSNKEKPVNLLIEGDNYHSLAVLNFTHQKSVDFIYIDPPYNTGNNDFLFNDNYVDKEDPWRHSKWLSFMEKRLYLAKNLLKSSGIIFISIDDNEFAQLKLLCDDVFEEKNFIAAIVWQKVYSPKNQSKRISNDHEYVFAYARNIDSVDFSLLPRTEKMNARYKNPDNDPRGPWKPGDIVANEERKKGHYIIRGPHGDEFNSPPGKHWGFSEETMKKLLKDKRLYFGRTGKSFPALKQFLSEVQQGRKASTLFLHEEAGHTDEAKKELKDFFEQSEELFSTPKPTKLIKQLLMLCQNKDATVLDFMAGSGTTGQAVLSLNKEDGGKRKFILCTNNENEICANICYPRILKVMKGYRSISGKQELGLGGNLKYFKTDFVGSQPTDRNKRELVNKSAEMICTKEDIFEVVSDKGLEFKIYQKGKKYLGVVFNEDVIDDFKKEANKFKGEFIIYCFSYAETVPEREFSDFKNKHRIKPIPEVILRVYREIFKR